MEWISSTELMEMLRRFPDTEIEAKRYTLRAEHTLYSWEYRKESSKFCYQLDGKTKQLTERGFLRKFRSDHWRPEQFFFLDDEKQKSLAVHLVEHLTMTGNLDWILCECDVTFLRKCDHCHKLMNEGWMCGETYHYCSDECLLAENPGITQEDLDNLVADDDSDIYWTEWED